MPESIQHAEPSPVEPAGGAGVYDVDPPQDGLSQDPQTPAVGDVDAVPEREGV
jgi:hypothetical protein